MATVLFAWELGSGLGHCVKLAPLAQGLLNAGHDVYFAARDVVTAQRVFQTPAVKYLPAPCLLTRPTQNIQPRTFAHVLHNIGFGDKNQLQALVRSWRDLFQLVRPTAIIFEHAPSALLASRWITARRIVIGTGFSLPPDASPFPDLCKWAPPANNLAQQEAGLLSKVNHLLRADGLPLLERLSQLYADVDANFLMTFSELDHHPDRVGAHYWGSWAPKGGTAIKWAAGDRPHVFAYLKLSSGPWRTRTSAGTAPRTATRCGRLYPRSE